MTKPAHLLTAAALLAALTGCGTDTNDQPATTTSSPTPPATTTARGTITLGLPGFAWNPGDGCWGHGDRAQVRDGATVTITDNTGATVALGKLSTGTVAMQTDDPTRAASCTMLFEARDVPTGRKFYGIDVPTFERVQVPEAQLGNITLELG